MESYQNFIGIDIGKLTFVVALYGQSTTKEYANTPEGIAAFIEDYAPMLAQGLCVAETTGGYELALLCTLAGKQYAVHRADGRQVKYFIRSLGQQAKTDALDAKGLARYAYERASRLALFTPASDDQTKLFQLAHRRHELTSLLVAEKNRLQSPTCQHIKKEIQSLIDFLRKQYESVQKRIDELIQSNVVLKEKQVCLESIPGIGKIVSSELLILMPELGQVDRRKIAALSGLAPQANESGKMKGYRKTGAGREGIKRILFMAAMAARNSKSDLKAFYERLIANGKKKMVALTALMRKIIVIANAKLKVFATLET